MRRMKAAVAAALVTGVIATVGAVASPAWAEEVTGPTADISVTGAGPATAGTKATFEHTFTVVNNGPDATENAQLQVSFTDGLTVVSSGDCFARITPDAETAPRYQCVLGPLQPGEQVTVTFVLTAKKKGTYRSRGSAYGELDLDDSNNLSDITTVVGGR